MARDRYHHGRSQFRGEQEANKRRRTNLGDEDDGYNGGYDGVAPVNQSCK